MINKLISEIGRGHFEIYEAREKINELIEENNKLKDRIEDIEGQLVNHGWVED